MRLLFTAAALAWGLATLVPGPLRAQQPAASAAADPQIGLPATPMAAVPRIGIGVTVSTLGPGVEVAARVLERVNLRAGFNDFSIGPTFNNDGIAYAAQLGLRSVEAHLDWFFAGSFHLSPGALLYDGNHVNATATMGAGQSFTLGNDTYTSDPAEPVTGSASLAARKVAPMLTLGWGNLVPRSGSRFGIHFEAGAAYQGAPQFLLGLTGNVCDADGNNCQSTSNSAVQDDVQAEQTKINGKLSIFKLYPVLSLGFSYAF